MYRFFIKLAKENRERIDQYSRTIEVRPCLLLLGTMGWLAWLADE